MESYFHRAGRRVPVYVSTCAFVVPRAAEEIEAGPDWAFVPLARRHSLLVRPALIARIASPRTPDRRAILRRIRTEAREPSPGGGLAPTPDAAPVLARGSLLLCPTGAVVAQFPEGTSSEAAAHMVRDAGWSIERPIRFLDRGYVLRADPDRAQADPLEVANRLVEDHGCRFAHPVLLEEVVGADAEAAPGA